MLLLLPGRSGVPALTNLDAAGLLAAYAAPRERWVRCNMVTSLDGAATGADGRSGSINNDADHVVFEVLRALSHVVVVGGGITGLVAAYRLSQAGTDVTVVAEAPLATVQQWATATVSGLPGVESVTTASRICSPLCNCSRCASGGLPCASHCRPG